MFIEFVEEQILLFVALGVIIAMLVMSYFGDKLSGFQTVSAEEAVRLYNNGAWVLDVRTDAEYKSGFIGEAVNLTPSEVSSQLESLKSHQAENVLVYCQSGARSASVAKQLVKAGFTKVHNLSGGVMSWRNAGLPLNKVVSKKKQKRGAK
ncbi:MAG: rhodanese-like domain-containing protein [Piscirickettsiaceae bacterium CG_4_9_14_3_um_filter_43_564]|nr:rhodanese-like domain-containing protein [Thiomicrospira sp.]PIQ06058.1 MAG: sulfurtransferase [Piscirickettsiaceae bacterium CG18_big_fil_WC_8_21_14_2_50_44_103]PIU38139.1 MAG: rhodanese-like domain-containing protein [Piscirickettsiaceae bacterium CG07_land_8_20_14_0_80_44_28]PIW57720.1 MAG: rhodanese-like domain-containing protein [Piscirickettsiaceae bacterium CG12_big_fil_rev_8_21_14_0_65_44_934]PIW78681.1 MAG: rhodanese-like domain-containing protein [Piscirickettsiaceae bacterium CG_4